MRRLNLSRLTRSGGGEEAPTNDEPTEGSGRLAGLRAHWYTDVAAAIAGRKLTRTHVGKGKEEIRRRLERARTKLFEAVTGLTEEQMRRRPRHGDWSVAEVMAHLPVWERRMLSEADALRQTAGGRIIFPSQAEREDAAARGRVLPPPGIVHDLIAARWDTLRFLERLPARDLGRSGRHEERGDLTVAQLLSIIATHEEEQAAEIRRVREELGLRASRHGRGQAGAVGPSL